MDYPRGLELLFNLYQEDLSSKEDILTIVVHNLIINKLGLFVGLGDEWSDVEKGTELLPKGWNSNKNLYTLRYISANASKKYLVKAAKVGDDLLLTFLESISKNVQCITLAINHYVAENTKDFSRAYQNLYAMTAIFDDMVSNLHDESIFKNSNKEKSIKEEPKEKSIKEEPKEKRIKEEPCMPDEEQRMSYEQNRFPVYRPPLFGPPLFGPPLFGRSDLDPFSGGMSGSVILDPHNHIRSMFPNPHLPRGAVPTGARFDPIGPRFGRYGQQPNPDHLSPPGNDDMFM